MPADFLTAEELRLRNRKRRLWFSVVLLLLLLLVLGFFFGRPAVHAIKAFQARRHARAAYTFIEQEKWSEARDEATAAYQLYAAEPEAIRSVARFLTRVRNPEALDFWKQLRDSTPLTHQDLRDEAAIALAGGDMERATAAIDSLMANDGKDAAPSDWLLAALLAQKKNAPQDAQRFLQKVFDDRAANEHDILQAALLELQIASSCENDLRTRLENDAWPRIHKLAQGKSGLALDALILLAQRELSGGQKSEVGSQISHQPPPTPDIRPLTSGGEIAQAIEAHPLAKTQQKLVALDLRMHADPLQKDAIIQGAIAQWQESDLASVAILATWLNGHGEYQRVLDNISLEKALQKRELFLQYVDALGALHRWTEIKKLLEDERFALDPITQEMYLARCCAQLEEGAASANHWQRALAAAAGDVQKLSILGEYAEKNGAQDIAEVAYNTASKQAPKLRTAQQGRLRIAQMQRDTKKIHTILAEMLTLWPNDTAIQNDEAYTRLLLITSQQSQLEHGETGVSRVDGEAAQGSGAELAAKHQSRKEKVEDGDRRSDVADQKSEVSAPRAASSSLPGGENKSEGSSIADSAIRIPQSAISDELMAIEKLAAELVRREPSSLPHRTLLALTLLKQQRPIAALDVYNGINVSPNALTPSALAVHAAVLAANDQRDDAKNELAQIKPDNLLPEEQTVTADLKN